MPVTEPAKVDFSKRFLQTQDAWIYYQIGTNPLFWQREPHFGNPAPDIRVLRCNGNPLRKQRLDGGPIPGLTSPLSNHYSVSLRFADMSSISQDRLTSWFGQWRVPLRRFLSLRRNHNSADLDDIAQEVFLRMLRYDRSELVANPQAYLFKIAANVSVEWATRASRRQPHSEDWLAALADEADPETEFEREAMEHDLKRAIETLPSRAREILRLHYGEGLTHEVIAKQIGVTRRIVKRDLISAYAALRESLASERPVQDLYMDQSSPGRLP
jgi:RNA polymerase sigma factor (sigma-70 family)